MIGRADAKGALEDLLGRAESSQAAALTLVGDPGIGKTRLCEYLLGRASAAGFRTVSAAGVQWESGFELAAMTQVLRPLRSVAQRLPNGQRGLLAAAFGGPATPRPDSYAFATAALGCLVAAAEDRPLLVVIDDAHWLDASSVAVMSFVVRRLFADSIALLFTHRTGEPDALAQHWPRWVLQPLTAADVVALIAQLRPDLPPATSGVAAMILSHSRGNPLAITELAPLLDSGHCTGVRVLPDPLPLGERGQLGFGSRIAELPEGTRTALAVVAAAGSQAALVAPALARLDLSAADLDPALAAGVVLDTGSGTQFTHPLRRAAGYAAVSPAQRRAIHQCLAELTRDTDAERYAYYLDAAQASPAAVAIALESAAGAVSTRAGWAPQRPPGLAAPNSPAPAQSGDSARSVPQSASSPPVTGKNSSDGWLPSRRNFLTSDRRPTMTATLLPRRCCSAATRQSGRLPDPQNSTS